MGRFYLMSINFISTRNCRNFLVLLMFTVTVVVVATISIINSDVFLMIMMLIYVMLLIVLVIEYMHNNLLVSTNKIAITYNSAQFLPLTNATHNQLKVIIHYQTNDISLINTKINGVMQVFLSNGSLVRTSSFPNGFIVNQSD